MSTPVITRSRPELERTGTGLIASNSIWIAVDTAVGFAVSFIASVALARLLGPSKVGNYSYVLWLVNMTGTIAVFGVPMATRKFVAEYLGKGEKNVVQAIIDATTRFQLVMAIAVLSLGEVFVRVAAAPENRVWASIIVASAFPALMASIPTAANMAAQDFGRNVKASVVSSLCNLVGIVLSLLLHWDLVGLSASLLVARLVDWGVRYKAYREKYRLLLGDTAPQTLPRELKRRVRRFCLQSGALQIVNSVVWDRSEMLFLKQLSSIEQVAFYSLSFNITQQLLLLPQIFASAAGANVMTRVGHDLDGSKRMVANVFRYVLLLSLPLSLGVAALSAPMIRILYGSQYTPAIPVLAILAVFCVAKGALLPAQHLLIAMDRQDVLLKCTLATAVVNVILDVWLIRSHAAVGAAVANGVAQTLAAVSIWGFLMIKLRAPIPIGSSLRLLAAAGIMAVAVAAITPWLPPFGAAALGVPLGAAIYLTVVRQAGALHENDRSRLVEAGRQLPPMLRGMYLRAVRFVVCVE